MLYIWFCVYMSKNCKRIRILSEYVDNNDFLYLEEKQKFVIHFIPRTNTIRKATQYCTCFASRWLCVWPFYLYDKIQCLFIEIKTPLRIYIHTENYMHYELLF